MYARLATGLLAAAALLGLTVAPARADGPRVVVFCEWGIPYFAANQAVSPRAVADILRRAGLDAVLADADGLAAALSAPEVGCLVWCYGNTFPRAAAPAITAYHRRGGGIVALGVPFTHPCSPQETGGRRLWRDEGHEDWGGHDRIGVGRVTGFARREGMRLTPAPDAPLTLAAARRGADPLTYSAPAGVGGVFYVGRDSVPPEDEVVGIVAASDGSGLRGWPVAAVRHRCADFRGAVDVWAGCQWLCDPRDPAEGLLARQLLARSVVYCLEAEGRLSAAQARKAEAAVEVWRKATLLPPRRLVPYAGGLRDRLLPRCPTVRASDTVTVHSVADDPTDVRVALACLQGLVNRRRPRLYLIYTDHDARWLDWYRERGYVGPTETVAKADDVVARFRGEVAGAVLTDARFLNIATMLASVRRCVACPPELAARWRLPVLDDVRGRWRRDVDAYRWAFKTLWPAMRHDVLCHGSPKRSPQQTDYQVAERVFTFWVSGAVDGADEGRDPVPETALAEEILAAAAPNTAVIGWWGWGDPPEGIGEYWGMALASRYAKVTLGTEFLTNMSFHSGIPAPERLRQADLPRHPAVALDPGKVYVALAVLDSGNDPWYWLRPQRDVWEAPGRGAIPCGWVLGPALQDLAPGVAEWFYAHRTPRDELICALSGLGYMDVPDYGRAYSDRDAALGDYLAMTRRYMQRLDLRTVQTYHGSWGEESDSGTAGDLARYARSLPGLVALLPDIGRCDATTYERADYLLPGYGGRGVVPVFHCLTRYIPWAYSTDFANRPEDAEVEGLMAEVRKMTPRERPAFMLAFALSWTFRPEMMSRAARELGPEYVFVTPSELAAAFLRAKGE